MKLFKIKKKLKTVVLGVFSMLFLCFSILFFSYSVSDYGFAQESSLDGESSPEESTESDPSENTEGSENLQEQNGVNLEDDPNYFANGKAIVVTGVANTIEYLTSLYLYVTNPTSSTSVEMKYDPTLNALLLNSAINANALGIGFNEFSEGIAGSVVIGGSGNKLNFMSEGIYDDYGDWTGSKNSNQDSTVAIGGENNSPGSYGGSAVIGGKNSKIYFSNSVMIGSEDSSLAGHKSVSLGSKNSTLGTQDWNSVNMGYNNHGQKFTFLIGSGINTHGGASWTWAVSEVFAWSPGVSGFALHGGGLGGQPGFYVNVKNGFGLNTSTPRLTFDFRSGGPLRVIPALGVRNNAMVFTKDDVGIICEDEFAVEKYRGTLAYVERNNVAGFCGCNGKFWMPLSTDANAQALCTETKVDARKCNNGGHLKNVIFHEETKGAPRWDEEADDGKGAWINLDWTFMGIPSINSWDVRECSYTCAVGFHPNKKGVKGWYTGDCIACSNFENGVYITPGTGINDCEFACNAGYKYYKWAENLSDRCTACHVGGWTEDKNQSAECYSCAIPYGESAKTQYSNAGILFSGGIMWNGTTGSGEPYFRKFTTFSTGGEYGCDFECAPGFAYNFVGTSGNLCRECEIGTYSLGGKNVCYSCTNMNLSGISFSWTNLDGITQSYTIPENQVGWYTTKGVNGSNSCSWTCNEEIGLVKNGDKCKCPSNSHLELINGKPRCVSDFSDMSCSGTLGPKVVKGNPIKMNFKGNVGSNSFEWKQPEWTYKPNKELSELGACEWSCPKDYLLSGNDCKLPKLGKCSSVNGTRVGSNKSASFWNSAAELCSDSTLGAVNKIEINYFDVNTNEFKFYPDLFDKYHTNKIKYLVTWSCEGYNKDPKYSSYCYAYWDGSSVDGKCDNNRRDGDVASANCATDFSNCNDKMSCPTSQEKKYSTDGHGKTWLCPGVFGGKISEKCHSCDVGFVWGKGGQCMPEKQVSYCENKPSNTNHMTLSDEQSFVQLYNYDENSYFPEKKSFTLGSDRDNLGTCEFICDEGYIWWRGNDHNLCTEASREVPCEGDAPSGNVIYGKQTYSEVFNPKWNSYVVTTNKVFKHVAESDALGVTDLGTCEFTCAPGTHWKNGSCVPYEEPIEYPECGTVSEECPSYIECIDDKEKCEEDKVECENNCKNVVDFTVCIAKCGDDYKCKDCGTCEGASDFKILDGEACKVGSSGSVTRISANKYTWNCSTAKGGSIECGFGATGYYNCPDGIFENAHFVGERGKLTEQPIGGNVLFETDGEAVGIPCSFACNDGYVLLNTEPKQCVMCKKGTISSDKSQCVVMSDRCNGDEVYDEDKKQCVSLGYCYDWMNRYIDNAIPANASLGNDLLKNESYNFRPLTGRVERRCRDTGVTPNSCTFTCDEDYYCYGSTACTNKLECNFPHVNSASAYIYENPKDTTRVLNAWYTNGEYFSGNYEDEESFKAAVSGKQGCFYSCKPGYFYVEEGNKGCYSYAELNAYSCSSSQPNMKGFIDTVEKPHSAGQAWKWYDNYSDYEAAKVDGCVATCSQGARLIGNVCVKDCPAGKVLRTRTFGGYCSSCDDGYTPDMENDLIGGVPTKCKSLCAKYPDSIYSKSTGTCVKEYNDASTCESHNGEWKIIDGTWQCVVGLPEL